MMPKYRFIKGRNDMEIWSHDLWTFTILCHKWERPDGEKVRKGVTHHIESSSGDQMDHLDWNSNHTKTTESPGQLSRIDKYIFRLNAKDMLYHVSQYS